MHASEIRWIEHDKITDTVALHFIQFPAGWTQIQIDEADIELASDTNWWLAFRNFDDLGYISTIRLCDRVSKFTVDYDAATTKSKKILTFNVTFVGQVTDHMTVCSASIREYQEPTL